jgi:GNAT superfamily N-acetyltransferase
MPADNIVVRHAETADVPEILAMARELALAVEDPPPQIDAERFADNAFGTDRWCECFVVEREGSLIAYALVCRGFEAHTGQRRLWLGDLYVRPTVRKRGAGRVLMRAIARHAVKLGCSAVYWELWHKNLLGEAFYRRLAADHVDDLAIFRLAGEKLARLAD